MRLYSKLKIIILKKEIFLKKFLKYSSKYNLKYLKKELKTIKIVLNYKLLIAATINSIVDSISSILHTLTGVWMYLVGTDKTPAGIPSRTN